MKKWYPLLVAIFTVALLVGCGGGDESEAQVADAGDTAKANIQPDEAEIVIRDENNPIVTLETGFGKMTLELYRDVAPNHADSFLARVQDGFYDSTIFHRVVKNFMIQGGDPTQVGGQPVSYSLDAEFNQLPHKDGTLSMARTPDPNSAKTQFFICLGRNRATTSLDGQYTVFGQLLEGYDVLHKIGDVPVEPNPMMGGEQSKPLEKVWLVDAYESDAEGNPVGEK